MAKSDYVSITMMGYVAGMESDPEFVGCVFRRKVDSEEIPVRNKARTGLGQDKSKVFGVRTLGAVAASGMGRGVNRALIQEMGRISKGNFALVAEKYSNRYPDQNMTEEKVRQICEAVKSQAKDLLA